MKGNAYYSRQGLVPVPGAYLFLFRYCRGAGRKINANSILEDYLAMVWCGSYLIVFGFDTAEARVESNADSSAKKKELLGDIVAHKNKIIDVEY